MELQELRSFCTTARLQSMSKAAEHLGLFQPTVTKHIKKLEEQFGRRLFDRMKRPIQLTPGGIRLAELAEPLVNEIDNLVDLVSTTEPERPIRVVSTYAMVDHVIPVVVQAFMSLHSYTQLQIRAVTSTKEVLESVEEGAADVGFLTRAEASPSLDFQGLFTYERVAVAPLGHPLLDSPLISLEEIAQWPLILTPRETYLRTLLEREFRRRRIAYHVVVELDDMEVIKKYVVLGLGVSVASKFAIEPEDHSYLGVVGLATLLPMEQAGIVTLRRKTLSRATQNLISVAKNVSGSDSWGFV